MKIPAYLDDKAKDSCDRSQDSVYVRMFHHMNVERTMGRMWD